MIFQPIGILILPCRIPQRFDRAILKFHARCTDAPDQAPIGARVAGLLAGCGSNGRTHYNLSGCITYGGPEALKKDNYQGRCGDFQRRLARQQVDWTKVSQPGAKAESFMGNPRSIAKFSEPMHAVRCTQIDQAEVQSASAMLAERLSGRLEAV